MNTSPDPQDFGHPETNDSETDILTVHTGHPTDATEAQSDVQSDPALSVYPGADWADEGGSPAPAPA